VLLIPKGPLGTGLGLGLQGDLYPGKYTTGRYDFWGESMGYMGVKKSKNQKKKGQTVSIILIAPE
jgi:hypothetical protein